MSGLAGVIVCDTKIATVGKGGSGLTFRGYSIDDLCKNCIFEEVAFLLLYGKLPSYSELNAYRLRFEQFRELSSEVRRVLEIIPANAHPMDVLKIGCALQGTIHRETAVEGTEGAIMEGTGNLSQHDVFDSLISSFCSMILYHYHFHKSGQRIDTRGVHGDSIAENFIRVLHQKSPNMELVRVLNISLILYAEHGLAASTFSARVTTSTLADSYSAICSAIGTLRGPLHGGANEAAMHLIEQFSSPEEAVVGIRRLLKNKTKIMGFGHRVYKIKDPRNSIIKECSRTLSQLLHGNSKVFRISQAIEKEMWDSKKLFANLDFYAASSYHQCGIPTNLFTPIFVIARTAGWGANIIEQRKANRLIRPSVCYVGPELKKFIPIKRRVSQKSSL